MAKYLYWRGNSLWCTYPLPDKPPKWPMGIKRRKETRQETERCVALGELKLSEFRVKSVTGELTAQRKEEYNPSYCALVLMYYQTHLKYEKSGKNEWYHLKHSLVRFGRIPAKEITREDIVLWRQEQKQAGVAVNTINNRYAYMQAAYEHSNSDSLPEYRLNYDPTLGMEKLPGAKVRSFVLTEEKFERNYALLRDGKKWPNEKPNKHMTDWMVTPDPRFALFYLALWETGRRPEELSQYTWDMATELEIDGRKVRFFFVSPELAKTDEPDQVVISDRLWYEITQLGYRKGLIFRNSRGDRWQEWRRHKLKLEKVFGTDAGWIRDCRRGFVTHKTEVLGHDPMHVRMQSGHKTDSVFERYRIGNLRNQMGVVNGMKKPNVNQKMY